MINQTISHYRIVAKLGEGGMGVVYKAEDLDLHVPRALKFLPPHADASQEDRARLEREARAAASLEHPAICPVHEIGRADGHTFIVMSYLEGRTLAERLGADGSLPVDEALDIAVTLAGALSRAHAAGVVHRDIKPANVMLTDGQRPVLMDFGLARMAAGTQLTQDGATLGTAAYMAPEQVRGDPVDGRTDIWALGVMIYEMLAGRSPFGGEYPQAAMYAILHEEPAPLTEAAPGTPYAVERIVERCLAKDPARRFATADELQEALTTLRDELAAGTRVERFTRLRRLRRRRRLLAAAAVLVVVAAAIVGWRIQAARDQAIDAVVVLPFFNLSGDPAHEVYADGMTDALITELQQLTAGTALRVIGRTSSMHYKQTDMTLPEIARELDVDAVIEASVFRSEDQVRVAAKLIRADPEQQLWADSFERTPEDVLQIHAQVAASIAGELALALSPEAEARLARHEERTVDPRAYELYLQARHYFSLTTVESVRRSIELYEQALAIDDQFALAWSGLSEAQGMYGQLYPLPPREVCQQSRASATRALAIDPDLADAHAVLADVIGMCDGASDSAMWHIDRALAINPSNPRAHLYRAQHLSYQGEGEASQAAALEAQRLDPFSPFIAANVIWRHQELGQFDAAEAAYGDALELDPGNQVARWGMSFAYLAAGRPADAARILEEALAAHFSLEAGSPEYLPQLVEAYVALERQDDIAALHARIEEARAQRYMPAIFLALTHAGLESENEALAMLRESLAEGDYRLAWWLGTVRRLLYGDGPPTEEFRDIAEQVGGIIID